MANKRNKNEVIETEIEDVTVIDTDVEVSEDPVTEEETVEEKKPNKLISVLKKAAPIVVLGGVIATAFALGHSRGTDAACLAMLEDGKTNDEDSADEDTGDGDTTAEEVETEEF